MKKTLFMLFATVVLSGCAIFSPAERTQSPVPLPEEYSLYEPSRGAPEEWWQTFQNEELNSLVATALSGNFDVQVAWARLKQARALAIKSGATRLPSLDLDGGYTGQRSYQQPSRDADHVLSETEKYSLGLAAQYELDLWGRIASSEKAAELTAQASREDLEAAGITVAASVVETWTDLMAVRAEISILAEQIKVNEMLSSLQELRFAKSMASALDVTQQRGILAGSQAELPLLQAQERVLLNKLAVLVGKAPGTLRVRGGEIPELPGLPEAGLPADLLASRPDVRAAGLRLHAADWEVSVARADRLPALRLTGRAAYESGRFDLLFNNWVASLTAGLTGPIFDAGLRRAEVDRTRAVAEENLANYSKTVLSAVQEVEDSMANEHHQREYIYRLQQRLTLSKEALSEARLRYLMGQSDYLRFLTELLNEQSLERNLSQERAKLVKYRVNLYRALGGDWTRRMTPEGLAPQTHVSAS